MERCQSGRSSTLGKRVYRKVTWVRIPPSPPSLAETASYGGRSPLESPAKECFARRNGEATADAVRWNLLRRRASKILFNLRHIFYPSPHRLDDPVSGLINHSPLAMSLCCRIAILKITDSVKTRFKDPVA